MSTNPYLPPTNIFNPNQFDSVDNSLTASGAAGTYLPINNPGFTGSLSGGVCNITSITGTLQTAAQPNITSVGTLTSLTSSGGITGTTLTGTLQTAAQPNITSVGTLTSLTSSGAISGTTITGTVYSATTRFETNNTSSSAITTSSNGSAYGLHLHSVLAATNGIMPGSSISFNNSSSDTVPLGAIALEKIGTSQGEMVIYARNGASLTESCRFKSTGPSFGSVSSTILNINGATQVAQGVIKGSSTYVSGSAQRIASFMESTEALKIDVQATTTNGYVGTQTNHDFWLQSNNLGKLIVKGGSTYNVGIGSNAAVADKNLCILDGAAGGGSVACMRIGTALSNNNCMTIQWKSYGDNDSRNVLTFDPYGTSNALCINSTNRRVGIRTENPSYPFEVYTIDTANTYGGSWSYQSSSSGTLSTGSGSVNGVGISMGCSGLSLASGFYAMSDRRLKCDIEPVNDKYVDKFYEIQPVSYRFKTNPNTTFKEIGYISQDLAKLGYQDLINYNKNEDLHVEEEGDIEGVQMEIAYDRITAINAIMIKKLMKRIDALEKHKFQKKD